MRRPRFLYFDLGNVLVHFDDERSCRQMAAVAGVAVEPMWQAIFGGDLKARYEAGDIDDHQFHETVCRQTNSCSDFSAFVAAGSDIFSPNTSMMSVLCALEVAGHRLGILSNTCPAHWNFCRRQFAFIEQGFDVYALSYELRAVKPASDVYLRAAALAGVSPTEIFFTDDIAGHVAGALAAGFDAVQYTGTRALVGELRKRGLMFNY